MAHLPFPALVGLETAQQALLMLAVEPRLRGVILAAPAGTGKSSLARGLQALLTDAATPFVELPASIDAENLLSGLDLPASLAGGALVIRPGALARADGGIAYVDGINLLPDATVNLLLAVIDDQEVRVEREGISLRTPARFSFLGSYDPVEGTPRRHLLDRIGLIVALNGNADAAGRRAVLDHNLRHGPNDWTDDLDLLRGLVLAAREQLPAVTISPAQIEQLTETALAFGVEGHRVDIFAVYAACAAAALELRAAVDDADLEMAARLVIMPRATRVPMPPEDEAAAPPPADHLPPPNPDQPDPDREQDEQDDDESERPDAADLTIPEEQLFSAIASELPDDLDELPFHTIRRGRTGNRGATAGNRGRHIRSVPGDPQKARLDVIATVRAAAPWQPVRRRQETPAVGDARGDLIRFRGDDIRVKQYQSKAGALFCFAVDASGSMAVHRMRQAKGAVQALLQKAYVNRDRIALISFRGQQADLLLPPTQSVELAQRALELLPTGGGTPLASALLLAEEVAAQARLRGIMQARLILLTDGRSNVGLTPESDVQTELRQVCRHMAASPVQIVVVDTQRSYLSRGEARQLAEFLDATYAYLPNASSEQIAAVAGDGVERIGL